LVLLLLLPGVLTWRDCLEYTPAWDTLIWFAILISMSNGLNESGLINSFASMVGSQLNALNLGWQVRTCCCCCCRCGMLCTGL
jgi:DASS family divalent anion:Na+ symporter